jgi:AAA+ superfamily predicted ATPase
MAKPNPIISVQVPVFGFVRQFGLMLEDGLILPFFVSLSPIESEPSLSGYYNELVDAQRRKSIACMSGKLARNNNYGDDLRKSISKNVLTQIKPVIIADEAVLSIPDRILAVSDITLTGDGIDVELIADVLSICCNVPKAKSLSMMAEKDFDPSHLGIDDMAVAIRPGRSLARIVDVLIMLEADSALKSEDADDADNDTERFNGRGHLGGRGNPTKPSRSNKFVGFYDVTQPSKLVSKDAGSTSYKTHLFIENLSGYDDAQQWALDLKQDIVAWQDDEIEWSDLSTRLLLSGPPGTGKTTYAKALCNSLQIPLISTSVSRWLEASNLGDVLAAISATFKYANANSPCILFIDEIDNIGSRNGGGTNESASHKNDDYWASLINRLLELLDGTAKTDGVIILGATNRPDKIDPALLRSGRLEKHIIIPPPDAEALVGIIAHHLGPDLENILEQGAEASRDVSENSIGDVPEGTLVNFTIKDASSVIDTTATVEHSFTMKEVSHE